MVEQLGLFLLVLEVGQEYNVLQSKVYSKCQITTELSYPTLDSNWLCRYISMCRYCLLVDCIVFHDNSHSTADLTIHITKPHSDTLSFLVYN